MIVGYWREQCAAGRNARTGRAKGERRPGRGHRAAVAGGLVVCALGFIAPPASADPGTVPAMTAPIDGATVSGVVPVQATSSAPLVQFFVDVTRSIGTPPVPGGNGSPATASANWSSWSWPNG